MSGRHRCSRLQHQHRHSLPCPRRWCSPYCHCAAMPAHCRRGHLRWKHRIHCRVSSFRSRCSRRRIRRGRRLARPRIRCLPRRFRSKRLRRSAPRHRSSRRRAIRRPTPGFRRYLSADRRLRCPRNDCHLHRQILRPDESRRHHRRNRCFAPGPGREQARWPAPEPTPAAPMPVPRAATPARRQKARRPSGRMVLISWRSPLLVRKSNSPAITI